jgi:hypothetical protein
MQSSQWVGKIRRDRKLCGGSGRTWKSCWHFSDIGVPVHHVFLRQVQRVNPWYYLEVLKRLRENVRKKKPQLWRNNSGFLYHDNGPAYASLEIPDILANTNTTVLPQPPCSPDLTFSYFPNWNPLCKDDYFRRFKRWRKIRRRNYERSRQSLPGLFPEVAAVLGAVHECRRNELEGDKAHSVAGMSKKL